MVDYSPAAVRARLRAASDRGRMLLKNLAQPCRARTRAARHEDAVIGDPSEELAGHV